jgi:hypothetical protein
MVLRQNRHNKRVGGKLLFLKAKAPEAVRGFTFDFDLYIQYTGSEVCTLRKVSEFQAGLRLEMQEGEMTTQTKTFIDPSDILGIRLECGNCGMAVTMPVGREMNFKGLGYCQNCNEPWLVMLMTTMEPEIADYIRSTRALARRLEWWKETLKTNGNKGFDLSLEIATETEENEENKGK